uniref:KRR-R motif-containing protein 1 n=1 Tax=Panagrellus redivivus TaxID=6233 RepID=A0A7E4UT55_PANRE
MIANKSRHTKKLPPVRKKRVPVIDPINDLQIVWLNLQIDSQPYHKPKKIRDGPPVVYDKLYITDDETVYQWASKKLLLFRIFKLVYWLFRWFFDYNSFSPIWHSVLYVDDIVKQNRPIFVKDALIVHCQSIETFEKLIPYISGTYTRLMVHGGDINLDQLKRLLLPSVRKVEVTAYILLLESDEYDDAVQLVMRHVRGFRYAFKLESTWTLKSDVKAAVKDDRYLATNWRDRCHVIHWTRDWLNYFIFMGRFRWYSHCLFFPKTQRFLNPSDDVYVTLLKLGFLFLLIVLGRAALKSKPEKPSS